MAISYFLSTVSGNSWHYLCSWRKIAFLWRCLLAVKMKLILQYFIIRLWGMMMTRHMKNALPPVKIKKYTNISENYSKDKLKMCIRLKWLSIVVYLWKLSNRILNLSPFFVITKGSWFTPAKTSHSEGGGVELLCSETIFIYIWSKQNTFSTLYEWKVHVSQLYCK